MSFHIGGGILQDDGFVVLDVFERDAQGIADERLAGEKAAPGLLEIVGMACVVDSHFSS